MKVLDAIKKGFEIASKNLSLVLVVFIFNVIWNLSVIPFTPEITEGLAPGVAMTPALAMLSIIFALLSVFIQGGVFGSIKDIVKEGKPDLTRFTEYGARFYLRLLGLALVIILVIGLIGFLATLIVAASAPTGNAGLIALTSIVAMILVLCGIGVLILVFLSPYILVLEDTGVFQAIRVSVDFVKRLLLQIIGMGLLLILIGFGIGLIMGVITGMFSLILPGKAIQVFTGVVSGGVNGYLSIVIASCIVTYYLAMKGAGSKETASA